MTILHCQQDLDASLRRLVERDPRLAPFVEQCAPISLRRQPAGLEGLLQIILAQQVSVASARAIWQKFTKRFPACDVDMLKEAGEEDLRLCGLSRPKIRTVLHIIDAIRGGFDLDGLALQSPALCGPRLFPCMGWGRGRQMSICSSVWALPIYFLPEIWRCRWPWPMPWDLRRALRKSSLPGWQHKSGRRSAGRLRICSGRITGR